MKQIKLSRFWTGLSPWIFIGAVGILFPIFSFIAVENIHRQKENTTRLLMEKGAALIRSFEAGTRTGMGMRWGNSQLQKLLTETASQPDIDYILVIDTGGTILAHNDPEYIGKMHGEGVDPKRISLADSVQWRVVKKSDGHKIFEVFRKFSPTPGPMGMHHRQMMSRGWFRRGMDNPMESGPEALSIFVGLDMTSIEAARKADTRHFLFMVFILLLIGFAGIILLFLFQSYRATKASLSRIKAFSDTLVENMPIGLVAIDVRNRIASINTVAGSVLGLSYGNVIGRDAATILPDEMWHQVDRVNREGGGVEKEIDCTLHNDQAVSLELSVTPLLDGSGGSQGNMVLFKDLSEVKSLREEVARNQRLATVGRLAAGVAHEVRNPLSSIKGFATYFKERYRQVPEDQQIANIMIQEVDRLNRVVGQLLEFARPVDISKKSISLKTLIENSLKLIERQAQERGVSIRTDLPPADETAMLDPDKINQVLLNLYLNAVESMEREGRLSVVLETDGEKNCIKIQVTDTGLGISEKDLAHIFDPYFTTKASGTGLGLAIAHNIIQGHNGEIRAESHLGGGSTFTILMPAG